jgi:hypothetical protein
VFGGITVRNIISVIFPTALIFLLGLTASCSEKSVDGGNRAPAVPSNPSPADGAGDQPLNVQLSWDCSDPESDALSYDVCLGTAMDPPVIAAGLDTSTLAVRTLEEASYYYWKIIARDQRNNLTESPLWWFSTGPVPTVYHIMTYNHPQRIYDYWVEDGLLYLVAEEGLDIVDALRLAEPTVIGSYVPSDTGVYIGCVSIEGRFAYLGTSFSGMQIVDISTPSDPQFVGAYSWGDASWASCIFVEDNLAYIADGSSAGLRLLDVSDPEHPMPTGYYDYPWSNMLGWEIVVAGSYAYYKIRYSFGGEDYILVINVSDPANPFLVTYIFTGDYARNIFVEGNNLYIPYAWHHVLRIFDISDPTSPQMISEYPGEPSTLGFFIQDSYAYAIMGALNMHVIDVSDPGDPQFVTKYLTERQAYDVFVEGQYIYLFDSGYEAENMNILWFVH